MRLRAVSLLVLAASAPMLAAPAMAAQARAAQAKTAQAPPPSSAPSFGEVVEVNVVNVEVYATDKAGNRVNGLKKEDFTLFEDGKPVEITNFAIAEGSGGGIAAAPAGSLGGGAVSAPETLAPDGTSPAAVPDNPLSLVLFVDNLHLHPGSRSRALEQVRRFLSQNVRKGDRVMVATGDPGLHIRQPFTDDPAALDAALREIERLPVRGGEADRSRSTALRTLLSIQEIDVKQGDPCGVDIVTPVEGYAESTRDDVLRALKSLTLLVNSLAGVPGRKAVVHISDGLPVNPGEELFQVLFEICGGGAATSGLRVPDEVGIYDATSLGPSAYRAQQAMLDAQKFSTAGDLAALTAHANANRVTIYPIQASGLQGNAAADADLDGGEKVLQLPTLQSMKTANFQSSLSAMASDTGGRAILNANDFLPDLARVRQDFSNYYSLGYASAHTGDGRQHRIEIKTKKPGIKLRYRQGYRDKPLVERMVDRTLAALLHGMEDNPLGITVEIGDQTPSPSGTVAVPVRLKIPLFKLAVLNRDDKFQGSLRLFVVSRNQEGVNSAVRQVSVPLDIPRKQVLMAMGQFYVYTLTLQLAPGEQRVAVAVRDEIAATTSFLGRDIFVGTAVGAKAGAARSPG
jgi:VWFA-related protein